MRSISRWPITRLHARGRNTAQHSTAQHAGVRATSGTVTAKAKGHQPPVDRLRHALDRPQKWIARRLLSHMQNNKENVHTQGRGTAGGTARQMLRKAGGMQGPEARQPPLTWPT